MAVGVPPGRAYIVPHWKKGGDGKAIPVQYNPGEMTLEKRMQFAEIAIPGLTSPLLQFVRGQTETLTIELFFDSTENGMGATATSVTGQTDKIYSLARIEPKGHAPPTITFHWSEAFPGKNIAKELENQHRDSFTGVIVSIRQHFTLFSAGGLPLRAKLSLTINEVKTLKQQLDELNLSSPDRTHGHVLSGSDQLWSVAYAYYTRASEWRRVADANAIEDPRRLTPGVRLAVPSINTGVGDQ